MTGPEPPTMICGVCGRTLDSLTSPGGRTEYLHALQDREHGEDHPAVPVPIGHLPGNPRCDFCNADRPGWTVPARTFEFPSPMRGHMSQGGWAACDVCAELISHQRWDALARRAYQNLRPETMAVLGVAGRGFLVTLYNRLRKNVTGPPERVG